MEATVLIGAMIIGLTQLVKYIVPSVKGWVTILIAILVGVAVGLLDQLIGVTDITVAQGIVIALSAIGVTTVAQKVGVNSIK
mgnify:CR=1 FL=1